jgi:hypothetical protein
VLIWSPVNAPEDRFGTDGLRAGVLASWADSPTRFREDANAEEDLLLGGYADRWLVELAQNAADAAQRDGVPGRLLVRVVATDAGAELRVANTGAPLNAAGVAALASLRASTKRGSDEVGRFGVGFAAVLGVSGEPRIVSSTGGVAFSGTRTAAEVEALGGVAAEELGRRDGRPPVLRLCWPVAADEPEVPPGYVTEVRLPVDPGAGTDPAALLAGADSAADELLLALPWLVQVTVGAVTHLRCDDPDGTVTLQPGGARWLLTRRSGELAAGTDRAVEERTGWSVCWALPLDGDGRPAPLDGDVLHAPTPSDERLGLPARLFATLPMQPSRRRVRTGPDAVTSTVLAQAAEAYLDLLRALPPRHRLAAAPQPGFPRSELDELLRAAVTSVLRTARWLPAAAGEDVAPVDAVLVELPGLTGALADLVPGLLADSVDPAARTVLTALGARVLAPAELADQLAGVRRPPGWWRELYAMLDQALDAAGPALSSARDELAALPVPLVDGRTVTGPRTALALTEVPAVLLEELVEEVRLPGLRIVHPDAVHPLLYRLGAAEAGPVRLLDHPGVVEAVGRSVADAEDGVDTAPLARLVLGLLDEIGAGPSTLVDRPWLAALALPDADGEPRRADELMLPDAALAALLAPDAPLGVLAPDQVEEYPRRVLAATGVLDSFALLVDERPTGPEHDLADEDLWWDSVVGGVVGGVGAGGVEPARLVAVRDLDLVRDDAWPAALAVLAADPQYRAALRARPGEPEPYTAWWLSRNARLAGRRPGYWRLPGALELAGLFDPVPAEVEGLDGELLAAIGVRRDTAMIATADTADAADLLARLGDPDRVMDAALTWRVHDRLAAAVLAGRVDTAELGPPERVRAVDGSVVDAGRAALLDHPWLAAALQPSETVAGRLDPEGCVALAELLDLPLASEVVAGRVLGDGTRVGWRSLPEVVAGCAALGIEVPDGVLVRHRRLTVVLSRPSSARLDVPVWVQDGWIHAVDPVHALIALFSVRSRTD